MSQAPNPPPLPPGLAYPSTGYVPTSPPPSRNGLAIATLIFGIIGWFLVSIPLGIAALSQIAKRRQRGKGMAWVGLALSGGWILVITLVVILIATAPTKPDVPAAANSPVPASDVPFRTLAVGDCVASLPDGEDVATLPKIPCSQPHTAQVFVKYDLPDAAYDDKRVDKDALEGCQNRVANAAPKIARDRNYRIAYLRPYEDNWNAGDHGVICLAVRGDKSPRTGSVLG